MTKKLVVSIFRRRKKSDVKSFESENHQALMSLIKGYKSYSNVKVRQETDKALRNHLYEKVISLQHKFTETNTFLMEKQYVRTWKAVNDIKTSFDDIKKILLAKNTDVYRHSTFFETPDVSEWIDVPVIYIIETEMILTIEDTDRLLDQIKNLISGNTNIEVADVIPSVEKLILEIAKAVSDLYGMIWERAELIASFEIVGF